MKTKQNNFAFIDSQNVNLGVKSMGWKLDFKKFRVYLRDKYDVTTAYLFIGYLPENQNLYASLQKDGFVLIFKPVFPDKDGVVKGNVDADLVLHAMIHYPNYDQAVIVTSDGDFYSLVRHLDQNQKLRIVLSPYKETCSILLRKSARDRLHYMDTLRGKLAYIRKSTA